MATPCGDDELASTVSGAGTSTSSVDAVSTSGNVDALKAKPADVDGSPAYVTATSPSRSRVEPSARLATSTRIGNVAAGGPATSPVPVRARPPM